jgi:uncharacterized protein YmfQ (DUF2313 family)
MSDKIFRLLRLLLPRGRAFKVPFMGEFWKVLDAFSLSIGRTAEDGKDVLDGIIPDNANFDVDDAANWERRLGMISNSSVSLADRKAAIYRKMAHPNGQPARQHYLFVEYQLRLAGFDVRIYENRFLVGSPAVMETKTPTEILGIPVGLAVYGDVEYGETAYGASWADEGITIIANYLESAKDATFSFGANLRSTFYIAGSTITTFADVDADREIEFRELVLKLKPAQTVGIAFVNYI